MTHILCMNKLRDYSHWRKIFDSHKQSHIEAGFHLKSIWHSDADPNEIYFIFKINDRKKAENFFASPLNAGIAEEAGVMDGWIKWVEELDLY